MSQLSKQLLTPVDNNLHSGENGGTQLLTPLELGQIATGVSSCVPPLTKCCCVKTGSMSQWGKQLLTPVDHNLHSGVHGGGQLLTPLELGSGRNGGKQLRTPNDQMLLCENRAHVAMG